MVRGVCVVRPEALLDVICSTAAHRALESALVIEDNVACFKAESVGAGAGVSHIDHKNNQREVHMSRAGPSLGVVVDRQYVALKIAWMCSLYNTRRLGRVDEEIVCRNMSFRVSCRRFNECPESADSAYMRCPFFD